MIFNKDSIGALGWIVVFLWKTAPHIAWCLELWTSWTLKRTYISKVTPDALFLPAIFRCLKERVLSTVETTLTDNFFLKLEIKKLALRD